MLVLFIIIFFVICGTFVLLQHEKKQNQPQSSSKAKQSTFDEINFSNVIEKSLEATYTKDFVVLDFETTGFSSYNEEIVEIGAIKFENLEEVGRFSCYVKPSKPIPVESTKIHGITDSMVKNAEPIEYMIKLLYEFIDDYYIVAHNSKFDMSFLWAALRKAGIKSNDHNVIDTLSLSRKILIGMPNYKLETLKSYYGIKNKSHSAIYDCESTAQIYQNLVTHIVPPKKTYKAKMDRNDVLDINSKITDWDSFNLIKKCFGIITENSPELKGLLYADGDENNLITISMNYIDIFKLKLSGKLKYVLLDKKIPLDKIDQSKITPSTKNDTYRVRILIDNEEDLCQILQSINDELVNYIKFIQKDQFGFEW